MNFGPNPHTLYPLEHYDRLAFLKNVVTHPNILVGDYTYYDDFENVANFEKNVKYLFDFGGDKLIIGKFCMIASEVVFLLNGANHLIDAISTYPFSIFGHGWEHAMDGKTFPNKGNTVIGHDVWIGYRAAILPGVQIGHGAVIGAFSVVTKDVATYSIVGGNPAKLIKKRFSEDQIDKLLALRWWDWDAEKITRQVELLTGNDLEALINAAT